MRVLVTRPERPAARTAARLQASGHEVISDPLLELRFHPPEVLLPAETPDGVVLTSANAVRALARHPDLPRLLPLKLWTVGSRTTAAARELGFQDVQAEALDLERLAGVLSALPGPMRFLHLAGADRAGDLGALVQPSGHQIETVVVYDALQSATFADATIDALRQDDIDAVLHYSRRTAEGYLSLVDKAGLVLGPRPIHICLSEAVADPLRRRGGVVRVATLPTEDALLACLELVNPPRQVGSTALDTSEASTARTSMADPENPRSETEGTAKRSMKPRTPVLDLKAKEIAPTPSDPLEVATPGIDTPPSEADAHVTISAADAVAPKDDVLSGTSEGVAGDALTQDEVAEPRSTPKDAVLADGEPRSSLGALVGAGLAGAVIAIVIFLVLVSAELIPLGGSANPALGNRVAGLEGELQTLSQRVQSAPSPDAAAGTQVQDLAASVQALRTQVEQQAAAPALTASTADATAALDQRLTELTKRIDELPAPAADSGTDEAVSRLSSRVDELTAGVSAARQPDPAVKEAVEQANQAASAAKEALDRVGKAVADAAKAQDVANRASVLAAAASLESAIARGLPYRGALNSVRERLPGATVQTLETGADKGLPTLDVVAARLKDALEAAPRPEPVSTRLVDRFVEGARSMVRVRPAEGSAREIAGEDAWAVRSRVVSRLNRRAYAEALAEWDALDAGAKAASQEQADALKARLGVDQALDALREQALAGAEAQP
jgi:uroporphyrinogen-III synthase